MNAFGAVLVAGLLSMSCMARAGDDIVACSTMETARKVGDDTTCARLADRLMQGSRWPEIYADSAAHCQARTGEPEKALASLGVVVSRNHFIDLDRYLQDADFESLHPLPGWQELLHEASQHPADSDAMGVSVDIRDMDAHPPAWPEWVSPNAGPYQVTLVTTVAPDDSVACIVVETSSGNDRADRSALRAAVNWRYHAGTSKGRPVFGKVRIPVRFHPAGFPERSRPQPASRSSTAASSGASGALRT